MELILSTLINGLSLGGIYAMIALGYTMVYGIAKMLNFAHGDIIMVGGYVIYVFMALHNPLLAVFMAVIFCILLGITIEKVAYKPLRGASPLAVLITAIGVSYFLQNIALLIWGANPKMFTILFKGMKPIHAANGQLTITPESLFTILANIIIMVLLTLFVNKTKAGKAMRAVSEDNGAAQLMGINVNQSISLTFAIGSGLAAVAGVLMLSAYPVLMPTTGAMPGIKAFTAAVIGGIGSIPGAMLGGILMGVVEAFAQTSPIMAPYTDAIEFSILIVILLVRPSGILGKKRREKV
jgi:branched-chain amino acid transport system permease protein